VTQATGQRRQPSEIRWHPNLWVHGRIAACGPISSACDGVGLPLHAAGEIHSGFCGYGGHVMSNNIPKNPDAKRPGTQTPSSGGASQSGVSQPGSGQKPGQSQRPAAPSRSGSNSGSQQSNQNRSTSYGNRSPSGGGSRGGNGSRRRPQSSGRSRSGGSSRPAPGPESVEVARPKETVVQVAEIIVHSRSPFANWPRRCGATD
jgi:hypothetical protein